MSGEQVIKSLRGKRITIVGLAREGTALSRFLANAGARVLVTDLRPASALQENLAKLEGLPITYMLGGHPPAILEADLVFLSPGVPLDAPVTQAVRQAGVPLSTETRLFIELCAAPVIGITGSSGKTTTTTLVGEMCRADERRTWVGGNIGHPLIDYVKEIAATDTVVMELSSFQLDLYAPWPAESVGMRQFPELARGCSPHIAAILNITPNHLDRHGDMATYVAAKENILRYQSRGDCAILSRDDPATWALRERAQGRVLDYGLCGETSTGAFLRGDDIYVARDGTTDRVCGAGDVKLVGRHNLSNILAACAIASAAGVQNASMAAVATSFAGVPHRLELVREIAGVRYYNDSIATSPERAMAALRSFDAPIILLAGGRDKHLPWDEWAQLVARKAKCVLTFGESAQLIEKAAQEMWQMTRGTPPPLESCGSLAEAVTRAARIASSGDIVLLSPGGTSFDAFRDFEERGRAFRELVNELTEVNS